MVRLFSILGHLQQWKLAQKHKVFVKEAAKLSKYLIKPKTLIHFSKSDHTVAILKKTKMGSGCGSVGREVVSNTRGLRFESCHWPLIIKFLILIQLTVNKFCRWLDSNRRPVVFEVTVPQPLPSIWLIYKWVHTQCD